MLISFLLPGIVKYFFLLQLLIRWGLKSIIFFMSYLFIWSFLFSAFLGPVYTNSFYLYIKLACKMKLQPKMILFITVISLLKKSSICKLNNHSERKHLISYLIEAFVLSMSSLGRKELILQQ